MKSDWFWLTGLHRQHCNKFNIEFYTMKNKWNNWGTSVDHWEDLGLSFLIISGMYYMKLGIGFVQRQRCNQSKSAFYAFIICFSLKGQLISKCLFGVIV